MRNIESVILTYNKPLKVRPSVKFDIKIFLIILILTFLLAYKLTDYAANFNTVKNKSRIEIIFLAIFFIFLFIPMSNINQDKVSVKENRMLAKWKPMIQQDGEINYNFGQDYDKWFNDRFNLRRFLTEVPTNIMLLLAKKTKKGIIDNNGFIYLNFEFIHTYLSHIDKNDYKALIEFDKFFKKHNIELYVLLVPDKGYIYPVGKKELVKDEYGQNIDNEIKKLNKNYNMHIINPVAALQANSKKEYMYFKTEHHWTDDGAFVGYKELMKEINKKHPEIKVLNENDFNYAYNTLIRSEFARKFNWGQSIKGMNMPTSYAKKYHKTKYKYYTHKDSNSLHINVVNIPYHRSKNFYYPKGANYRVILLGTSNNENLSEFIPYTFKHVFRLRNNSVKNIPQSEEFKIMKYHEKEILDYKPDIIVFCISYHNMYALSNLFNMK